MKVLHIYDHFGINCGVMSVVMNWYRNIDKHKVKFDFLASKKTNFTYEDEILDGGGNVYYMSDTLSIASMPKIIINTRKFMKLHCKEYDVIHLHTHTFAYPYLYYAKKYGAKCCITHAHSISLGNTTLSSVRNKIMVLPLKRFSDKYLACSELAGDSLFKPLGIDNYKIIINGIDFDLYKYDEKIRANTREKLNIEKDCIVVTHISNMSSIKNTPFVIDVFNEILKMHKNCKLMLIGKNDLPLEVEQKINNYELSDFIINLGIRDDVADLLQVADVCLMPSKNEGFGIVAIECQANNLPIITSDGFPESVYVSDKIHLCELNAKKWASMSINYAKTRTTITNLETAKNLFDIKIITNELIKYYDEIKNDYIN